MRSVTLALFLLVAACGGKAIDDPNYEAPSNGDDDGDATSPGGVPRPHQACIDVCNKLDACTPGAESTQCSGDCIDGYNKAYAIGCGEEYEGMLNCFSGIAVCDNEVTGCEIEVFRYDDCYN